MISAVPDRSVSSRPASAPDGGNTREASLPFAQVLGHCANTESPQSTQAPEAAAKLPMLDGNEEQQAAPKQRKDKRTSDVVATAALEILNPPIQPVANLQIAFAAPMVSGLVKGCAVPSKCDEGWSLPAGDRSVSEAMPFSAGNPAPMAPAPAAEDADLATPQLDRKPRTESLVASETPVAGQEISPKAATAPSKPISSIAQPPAKVSDKTPFANIDPQDSLVQPAQVAPVHADNPSQLKRAPDGPESAVAATPNPAIASAALSAAKPSGSSAEMISAKEVRTSRAAPSRSGSDSRTQAVNHSTPRPRHAASAGRVGPASLSEPGAPATPASIDSDISDDSPAPDAAIASIQVAAPDASAKETANSTTSPPSSSGLQPEVANGTSLPAHGVPAQTNSAKMADPSAKPADNYPVNASVQSAHVLERMGQSEMHVGVRTTDFGHIEVHTSLNQNHVDAVIATAHPELRSAMQAELPSLQRAMDRHQLQLDRLDVGTQNGGQSGASSDHSPRSLSQLRQPLSAIGPSETANSPPAESMARFAANSSRISVIA